MVGDYYNINDRITYKIMHRNTEISEETYQQPFELRKMYIKNEKGKLEVYIGNDERWHKVSRELRVNERSVNDMVAEKLEEVKKALRRYAER